MNKWNQILREKWYSKEEPDESIVNLVSSLKNRDKNLCVLDLGCGAGRHQVYMASQGIEAHGIDFSETGLNLTKKKLKKQKLESYLVKCDMCSLPYIDSYFDAVISLHTIYHQKLRGIQKTISEIKRVLKKQGLVFINFLSKRTYSYGKGLEIEENMFINQEGAERGIIHHFSDEEELKRLFSDFKSVDLKLTEQTVGGKLSSRWVLIAMV